MKKLIFITMLFLCSSLALRAQDSKPHSQPDSLIKVIPIDGGRHDGYLYTIGGKLQTREDVLIRLMRYAPAAQELSRAKTNLTWSYVSFAGTAISGIAATIEYAHNNKLAGATAGFVNGQSEIIYQHHNLTGAYILTGAATAFLTSSFINLIRAGKHANRSLQLYNSQYQ